MNRTPNPPSTAASGPSSGRRVKIDWAPSPAFKVPIPKDEKERLADLRGYHVLDTPAEESFDQLVALAAHICGTPIATISLVDSDRQWFKAKVGLSISETSRDVAFCAHAIMQHDLFIVPDATRDPRFASNPLVTSEPKIRFYAGAPLVTPADHVIGTLCVIDRIPRELTPEQANALRALSRQVVNELAMRREVLLLRRQILAQRRTARTSQETMRLLEQTAQARAEAVRKLAQRLRTSSQTLAALVESLLGSNFNPSARTSLESAQAQARALLELGEQIKAAATAEPPPKE